MSNASLDPELYQIIGEHKSDITSLKQDIKEIKDNQKVFIEFVTKQKAGRRYVWMLFGAVASIIAFGKDVFQFLNNLLTFKGVR